MSISIPHERFQNQHSLGINVSMAFFKQ